MGLCVSGATTSSKVLVENLLELEVEVLEPDDREDPDDPADPDPDDYSEDPDDPELPEAPELLDEELEEADDELIDSADFLLLTIFLKTILVVLPLETGIKSERSSAFSVFVSEVFLTTTVFFV